MIKRKCVKVFPLTPTFQIYFLFVTIGVAASACGVIWVVFAKAEEAHKISFCLGRRGFRVAVRVGVVISHEQALFTLRQSVHNEIYSGVFIVAEFQVNVARFAKRSWLAFSAFRGAYKHVQVIFLRNFTQTNFLPPHVRCFPILFVENLSHKSFSPVPNRVTEILITHKWEQFLENLGVVNFTFVFRRIDWYFSGSCSCTSSSGRKRLTGSSC